MVQYALNTKYVQNIDVYYIEYIYSHNISRMFRTKCSIKTMLFLTSFKSELKPIELDTLNTNCYICISTVECGHLWFLLNALFSPLFWIYTEFRPIMQSSLIKWRAKYQISLFLIPDWLNFIHFSVCKLKIILILRLIKRGDQALISISTILKFSALILLFSG